MRPLLFILLLCCISAAAPTAKPTPAASEDGVEVFFSPSGGAADAVIAEIDGARKTIDIAVYSVTHTKIAKAIREAHERGVKVRVILDRTQSSGKYSSATYLSNAGVPVWTDAKGGLMHDKIALIDGATIITGSFNYTKSADETNTENMLILKDKRKLTQAYEKHFQTILDHSDRYKGIED